MLDNFKNSIGIATSTSTELPNMGIMLVIMFGVVALLMGIPAILKRSLKGVLLAIVLPLFAAASTYLFLFM